MKLKWVAMTWLNSFWPGWYYFPGLIFCLLLGVSSGCARQITGQVTSVTWPVIGWAQSEVTQSKRQKTGPGLPLGTYKRNKEMSDASICMHFGKWEVFFMMYNYMPCHTADDTRPKLAGPHLNIKTVFPRYGDSHVKDKTVSLLVTQYLYTETGPRSLVFLEDWLWRPASQQCWGIMQCANTHNLSSSKTTKADSLVRFAHNTGII